MSGAPIIDFVSIHGRTLAATFANLPPGAEIVLVDKTSGAPFGASPAGASDGNATIIVPMGAPAGDYYLRAEDSGGVNLAQSVEFHFDADAGR